MAIFLITAPSGAGKTTFVKRLQKSGFWEECISHTTRKMREGEKEGVTYYYVNEGRFADMVNKGEFAERVMYNNNHYGVSHDEIIRVMKKGKHVAIIVEYDGFRQIKRLYPEAIGIFLYATKEDCMINMLSRGDKVEDALERIEKYDGEMRNKNDFDYVIKNVRGKADNTVGIFLNIIKQYGEW